MVKKGVLPGDTCTINRTRIQLTLFLGDVTDSVSTYCDGDVMLPGSLCTVVAVYRATYKPYSFFAYIVLSTGACGWCFEKEITPIIRCKSSRRRSSRQDVR